MSNRPRLGYLLLLVLLLGVSTACVARLEEMGETGSQGELQVMTPQPETAQPAEPPLTEVATVEPTTEPFVPTMPPDFVILDTPTPTPLGFEPEVGPTASATPTMSAVVDLAEGIPPQETMVYIVRRADGRLERYLIPVSMLPTDSTYPQVRDQLLNLGPEDVLIDAFPLQMRPMLPAPVTPPPADNP